MDDSPAQTRVVVSRSRGYYRDAARRYSLEVDGQERGLVRPGEELVIAVAPGTHRIRARTDWTGSRTTTVEVCEGQDRRLVVQPNGPAICGLWQIFGRSSYLRLIEEPRGL